MIERPSSIPEGLTVELSRGRLLPGASSEADDGELDLDRAFDRDHLEQAKRTKEPGWTEARPQLLLMPEPVRDAVLAWAVRPEPTGPPPR